MNKPQTAASLAGPTSAPMLFRVDASPEIGAGHFMRCMAIAEAYRDMGGQCVFVCRSVTKPCLTEAHNNDVEIIETDANQASVEDVNRLVEIAHRLNAGEVIADGYQFDQKFRKLLRDRKLSVVFLDDGDSLPDETDMVINQNIHAASIELPGHDEDLLGAKYSLLRRRFSRWLNWRRDIPDHAKRVLICFGGSAHSELIVRTAQALIKALDEFEATVVGIDDAEFESAMSGSASERQRFVVFPQTNRMDQLMAESDLALGASGAMTWERSFMMLPSITVSVAKNQLPLGAAITELGIGMHLGHSDDVSEQQWQQAINDLASSKARRIAMADQGRNVIDGYGSDRVAQVLSKEPVRLRRATREDCKLIFDWVNESTVREMSFTKDQIKWDTHVDWFNSRVDNDNCLLMIGHEIADDPIGQIRFDIDQDQADVSISVSPDYRGRGLSRAVLRQGIKRAVQAKNLSRINAFIQPGNKPSIQLFRGAGFIPMPATAINGFPALHYVFDCTGG